MSATREQVLANVRDGLKQLFTNLESIKMDVCVLQAYVEQELEKK